MKKMIFTMLGLFSTTSFGGSLLDPFLNFGPLGEPRYARIRTELENLAKSYPQSVRLFELGVSDSGESVVGVQIGKGATDNLVVATHHGNEYGSTEVALAFAKSLAQQPIPEQTLWIIPVLNINGYNGNRREEVKSGVAYDPNRDYPGPCGTAGPFNLKSTKMLADLTDRVSFVITATLHTFFPAVLIPWGISTHDTATPYVSEFTELGKKATIVSNYQVGNSTDLLYPADGTFEDFSFWKHGSWSMLFELGRSHSPNPDQVAKLIAENIPGLRKMFQEGPTQKALKHQFDGKCDASMRSRDRHDE